MSTSTVFTVTGSFLLMLFGYSHSMSNRRCLPLNNGGSYCFTQPDPPLALSWSAAQQWCQSIGATLPITDDNYHKGVYQNALGYLGLQQETLWLGANLTYDPNNWFWTDGSRFTEEILQNNSTAKTSAYVTRNGTQLKFVAASPLDYNGYICRNSYSEVACASSGSTLWVNGRCYYRYPRYYSWYSFRTYCLQSDMPSYDDLKELTRWLDISQKYWIGVRCGWWTWQDLATGRSFEMVDSDLPNSNYGQCMSASAGNTYSSSNCGRNLQFVCQEYLKANVTETTTITAKTTERNYWTSTAEQTTNLPRTAEQTTNLPRTAEQTTNFRRSYKVYQSPGLAIGLGVGGGVLVLTVIVWLATLAVPGCRRKRASNYSPVDPTRQSEYYHPRTTESNVYHNYTFSVGSETVERNGKAYRPVNPAANEYVY